MTTKYYDPFDNLFTDQSFDEVMFKRQPPDTKPSDDDKPTESNPPVTPNSSCDN